MATSSPTSAKAKGSGSSRRGGGRFSALSGRDARWQPPDKSSSGSAKVKLDARFAELFTNPDFAETFELDPLGRPVQAEDSVAHKLRRVYTLEADEKKDTKRPREEDNHAAVALNAEETSEGGQEKQAASSEQADTQTKKTLTKKASAKEIAQHGENKEKIHNKKKDPERQTKKQVKGKKGNEKVALSHKASKAVESVPTKEEYNGETSANNSNSTETEAIDSTDDGPETRRLAVCKCDWEQVKAVDILVLLQSFVPPTGSILSVTVYPSRMGYQRMQEEAVNGPKVFQTKTKRKGKMDSTIDEQKLRQYELEKLDYYYAVAECDSVATAAEVYKACEGLEFERTSNVIDLSFIPDDVTFDLPPREVAREIPSNYEAPSYYTKALQHSKVELTWDLDDSQRVRVKKKAQKSLDELKMSDFQAFLASESEESDIDGDIAPQQLAFEVEMPSGVEEHLDHKNSSKKKDQVDELDPSKREKYKLLLSMLENKDEEEEQQDMEITFVPGLSEKVQSLLDAKDNPSILKNKKRKREESGNRKGSEDTHQSFEDDDLGEDDGQIPDQSDESDEDHYGKQRRTAKKKKRNSTKKSESELKQEAELALLTIDENLDSVARKQDQIPSTKQKGRKSRKDKTKEAKEAASLDLQDPRFREVITSSEFAIDPTRLKKSSETVQKILRERSRLQGEKQSAEQELPVASSQKGGFGDASLNNLVASLKTKRLGKPGPARTKQSKSSVRD